MGEGQEEQDRQPRLDNEKKKRKRNVQAKKGWLKSLGPATRANVFATIIAAVISAILGATITGIFFLKEASSQQVPVRLLVVLPTAPITAQSSPTMTATTTSNREAIPYSPYRGTLVLNDPLRDNSQGYNWQELSDSYSSCAFTGGAYHVKIIAGYFNTCTTSTNTDFDNFAYEVNENHERSLWCDPLPGQ